MVHHRQHKEGSTAVSAMSCLLGDGVDNRLLRYLMAH